MFRQLQNLNPILLWGLSLFALTASGCSQTPNDETPSFQKPPAPVATMTLKRSSPSFARHTSATVAPWKAEQIGFEQAGRVVEVIEVNEKVIPRIEGADSGGTVLARLDDERLRIALETVKADKEVAQRRLETNRVAIEKRLPAGIESAEAQLLLSKKELARAMKLANAISRSEQDTIKTRATTARLQVESAKAELIQAQAEQRALEALVAQAEQRISEAERNLRNSVLYSSFPGQVAEVHAVPGTFAEVGAPVVTVLMMDPMVVEFEVTAEASRRYQRGDSLSLMRTDKHGDLLLLTGMVYTVDSVADPNTRTFTITLHVRNAKESKNKFALASDAPSRTPIARTHSISPLNVGSMVTGDNRLLVEQKAIHHINGKDYVWKITNRTAGEPSQVTDRTLTVNRLAVKTVSEVIPFLGKWKFVAVEFEDPAEIDVDRDLITGRLYFQTKIELSDNEGTANLPSLKDWTGNQVLIDDWQWQLRAGDVVQVKLLAEDSTEGFYVPMKAVRRENEQSFVHVVKTVEDDLIVRRVPIKVGKRSTASEKTLQLLIEPVEPNSLNEGMQVVVQGTHFLRDGDRVRPVAATETSQ